MPKAGGTIFPFNGPEAHNVLRNPGRWCYTVYWY